MFGWKRDYFDLVSRNIRIKETKDQLLQTIEEQKKEIKFLQEEYERLRRANKRNIAQILQPVAYITIERIKVETPNGIEEKILSLKWSWKDLAVTHLQEANARKGKITGPFDGGKFYPLVEWLEGELKEA